MRETLSEQEKKRIAMWINKNMNTVQAMNEGDIVIPKEKLRQLLPPDYEKAYLYLMEYWDSLPDEQKPEIDKYLREECGL